jgi:HEAT repeat protein
MPLAALGLLSFALAGCANSWDEISRHDISFSARLHNIFSPPPDPLVVLRDSRDGDDRARALRSLKEPKQNKGTDEQQDVMLKILVTSAHTDPQALCRVAAIQALSKFKDPRAVQALIDAYYKATTFEPETATVVQCTALTALGETGNAAAVDLLTRVLRAPAPAQDVAESESQQEQDRRIAAARALGHFSHYQAAEALVHVLRTDRDVALRQRAHEALVSSTGGKDLGFDPAPWEKLLNEHAWDGPMPQPTKDKISLVGWKESK